MKETILEKTSVKVQEIEPPKLPQTATYEWIVDPEQKTTITYYFSEGEWWSEGTTQEKADPEAQKKITNAYIKEIDQKIANSLGMIDKTFFTEEEKMEFEHNPRHFFEKDLQINKRWIMDSEMELDKETKRDIKKHIKETEEIIEYLEKNPEKFVELKRN